MYKYFHNTVTISVIYNLSEDHLKNCQENWSLYFRFETIISQDNKSIIGYLFW